MRQAKTPPDGVSIGQCLCGKVQIEIGLPGSGPGTIIHAPAAARMGAAYATYVGCWRSRVRVTKGQRQLARFTDAATGDAREFCAGCGTPIFYGRARSPAWVNIPRALFDGRVGREPLYHVALADSPEWAYRDEKLKPLKGYPGVMWTGRGGASVATKPCRARSRGSELLHFHSSCSQRIGSVRTRRPVAW
jgi:hypothetical protein